MRAKVRMRMRRPPLVPSPYLMLLRDHASFSSAPRLRPVLGGRRRWRVDWRVALEGRPTPFTKPTTFAPGHRGRRPELDRRPSSGSEPARRPGSAAANDPSCPRPAPRTPGTSYQPPGQIGGVSRVSREVPVRSWESVTSSHRDVVSWLGVGARCGCAALRHDSSRTWRAMTARVLVRSTVTSFWIPAMASPARRSADSLPSTRHPIERDCDLTVCEAVKVSPNISSQSRDLPACATFKKFEAGFEVGE